MAYAKIVDNKIVEIDAADHDGEAGWKEVPVDDIGHALMYDTVSSSVRAMTDAEKSAEHTAITLSDAWEHLRNQRNIYLRDTDAYMVSDRPATTNMSQYRAYLRGLPATYNDTSILSQSPVMDFDAYVASL